MNTSVHNVKNYLLLVVAGISFLGAFAQNSPSNSGAPELVFVNPVLISGQDKKAGAVYRFSNVTPGVDAELKLKKFSRSQIVVSSVDNPSLGWNKAFQPEFGLTGIVMPNQNWYIDFELKFFAAGTDKKIKMRKVNLTTLDVDGDGVSISEYVVMNNAKSVSYSRVTYLSGTVAPPASVGQSLMCTADSISSALINCNECAGGGLASGWPCSKCDGTGKVFSSCQHAYQQVAIVQGPVQNFVNIDTMATQVMATYQYEEVDKISFRYGAKSGSTAVNGSGVRLNSTWFKEFSLAPVSTLPVKLENFNAVLNSGMVRLSWKADEENFSHYVIQRSTDGRQYSDIAHVLPLSNAPGFTDYEYKDLNIASPSGVLYYRLLMIDKTDEMRYSPVRIIRLGKETEKLQLIVYPNPVSSDLRLTMPGPWQGKQVLVEVYNSGGKLVRSLELGSMSQTEVLQTEKLARGVYLVKATCNGETVQQQFVKN